MNPVYQKAILNLLDKVMDERLDTLTALKFYKEEAEEIGSLNRADLIQDQIEEVEEEMVILDYLWELHSRL